MVHRVMTGRWGMRLLCACLLLLPRLAAAESSLAVDFDGDGRGDRATVDLRQPSVVHVWLSASDTTHVLSSRDPLQRIVASDLDGDQHPELIARDSQSRIHVWTHRRTGFHKVRPHRALPNGLTKPARRHVDDEDGQPVGAFGGTAFSMSSLPRASLPPPPPQDSRALTIEHAHRSSNQAAVDPFAPRPPPAPRLL
jgi:hypothetical protein